MTGEGSYRLVESRDAAALEAHFRRDPVRHLYELGDLDEPHWDRARWLGAALGARLEAVFLLYGSAPLPVFMAMGPGTAADRWLMSEVVRHLPSKVYAHVSEELLPVLQASLPGGTPVRHRRMEMRHPDEAITGSGTDSAGGVTVRRLGGEDLALIQEFYDRSHPGHWFVPEMLAHGRYFGATVNGALLSVAGTHIVNPKRRVASLGNIVTARECRGKGLAGLVTGALCRDLGSTTDHIGLNVRSDNLAAIRCYEKLGFETKLDFFELTVGAEA